MIQVNMEENQEAAMARFLDGLNCDIANMVELQHYFRLDDMVHMAIKVTNQAEFKALTNMETELEQKGLKKKRNFMHKAETSKGNKNGRTPNQGKSDSKSTRNRDIKCFQCLETSHIASQCPNKRVMILKNDGEIETKGEFDDESMPTSQNIIVYR